MPAEGGGRYQILILPRVARDIEHLPRATVQRLTAAIDALADDPRPPGCRQLANTSTERIYRLRVGDYRILYQVRDAQVLVLVVRVADRREVYDRTALKRLLRQLRER